MAANDRPRGRLRFPTLVVPRAVRRWHADEAGVGPISTVFGVVIFLAFLMMATQVMVHLYASSTVSAAAFDAARRATADGAGCAGASQRAYQLLGPYGDPSQVSVSCVDEGDMRSVTISGPTPARMVDAFGAALGTDGIERTARVRIEQFGGSE